MSSDSGPLAKRPKISLDPHKAELGLEKVLEVVSDVRTLVALSRVNKTVRSSVYRLNGLREIRYTTATDQYSVCSDFCAGLNGIHIAAGPNTEEKVNQGIQWLWAVGKGLRSLKIKLNRQYDDGKAPLPQLKLLALHGESRTIRRVKLRGAVYDEVLLFIYKYMDSLSELSIDEVHLWPLSGSKLEFWNILLQCEQLQRLHIVLKCTLPKNILEGDETPKLFQLAFKAPLRYLMIHSSGYFWEIEENDDDYRRIFSQSLTCENLRKNLETLALRDDGGPGLNWLINTYRDFGHMQPFEKVVELQTDLQEFDQIDWQACFALFPALQTIHFFPFTSIQLSHLTTDAFTRFLDFFSCGSQETKLQVEIKMDRDEIEQFDRLTAFWSGSGGKMQTKRTLTKKLDEDVPENIVLKKGNATLEFRFKLQKLRENYIYGS